MSQIPPTSSTISDKAFDMHHPVPVSLKTGYRLRTSCCSGRCTFEFSLGGTSPALLKWQSRLAHSVHVSSAAMFLAAAAYQSSDVHPKSATLLGGAQAPLLKLTASRSNGPELISNLGSSPGQGRTHVCTARKTMAGGASAPTLVWRTAVC